MATLDDRIEKQEKLAKLDRIKRERQEEKARTTLLKRANAIRARFDSLESSHDTQRIQSRREKLPEDDLYSRMRKLKGVALGRDLRRNTPTWKTIEHQFKVNVVGVGPKVQINTADDVFNQTVADWFNGDWAKWCDGIDDNPLADMIAMALNAVKREGDCVCVFDDFERDDGTIRWFEWDQLVTIDDVSWRKSAKKRGFPWKEKVPGKTELQPMCQKDGIVKDWRGRVVAYVLDSQHGRPSATYEEVTIIPRWHPKWQPKGSAKMIKAPWRFSQRRGQGDALTVSNQIADIYEMIAAELQSAKNVAQRAGWIEVDKDAEGGIIRALQQSNLTESEISDLLYGNGEQRGVLATQYEELEGTFGGRFEYLQPGEKMGINDHDKPASSVRDFGGFIQEATGASMGLGRSSSTLKAESSYTAFRGEQLMSWATYEVDQKWLERRLMDFLVTKAVTWALRKNQINVTAPDGWQMAVAWKWPKMREVDETKTANAQGIKLKNGTTNYSDIYGPDWRKRFESFSEELGVARQLELPLAVFEAKSGGAAPNETGETDE